MAGARTWRRRTGRPAGRLQAYQEQRYLRTARVQIMARVYGDFYHARGVARELRNQMLGAGGPVQTSFESSAWLYDGI